jgi:hypothetical protein
MLQRLRRPLQYLAVLIVVSFFLYWFMWPHFLFQEPKLYYFIEGNAEEIANISAQDICDTDQTKQRLAAFVRLKDPDIYPYFQNFVQISQVATGAGCSIQVPSGLDAVFYKINDACWLTGMKFRLPLTECEKK